MKKHKYTLTIEFETDTPIKTVATQKDKDLIQFENGLPYFVEAKRTGESVNDSFVYGSGKVKLKKVT